MARIPTAKGDFVVTRSIPLCLLILASVLHAQEADSQDPRVLRTRAAELYQMGKAKEAMELFSRAVELDPTSKDALLERESIDAEEFKLLMKGLTLPERELAVDHSIDGIEGLVSGEVTGGEDPADGVGAGGGAGVDHTA